MPLQNEFITYLLELLGPFGSVKAKAIYQAPFEAMNNSEELCKWAQKAYDAALGAAQTKHKKKRGRK
jgi:TfoX/Sxy family transcriptional regulator of competence genes